MKRLEVSGAVRPLYGSLAVKGLSKVTVKFTVEQATKAQRWSRGIALPFL